VDGKDVTTTVMTGGVGRPDSVAPHSASRADWCILRDTILESIDTSPGAFLATADQIRGEPPEFWERKLRSSTWTVVHRRDKILGIAAASSPGEIDLYALQEKTCFIESVWIAPCMRGNGVGERLVTYLIEQKRKVGIRQFYLWVFDHNASAIRLYKRMDFKPTGHSSALLDACEIQYLRDFDSDVIDDEELERNATARKRDRRGLGITYLMITS
jgi:ribosomal protein S18 acetylase RimI-like enzyme